MRKMQYINYIRDPANDYLGHTIQYLQLCGVSIAASIIIGVVLGALVSRNPFAVMLMNPVVFTMKVPPSPPFAGPPPEKLFASAPLKFANAIPLEESNAIVFALIVSFPPQDKPLIPLN